MSGAYVFGWSSPSYGEVPVSWQTWDDGFGHVPTIDGDPNWGKLNLDLSAPGEEGRSQVYDLGSSHARTFTLTENRYGTGGESATLQIRGDTSPFNQDDFSPIWANYSGPVSQTWRYVQIRETTISEAYYYVDYTNGNDSYDGLSPTHSGSTGPWKTVAKVNAVQASLHPGDQVLFKRGETWAEALLISQPGKALAPIVYGCYGSGSLPFFDGTSLSSHVVKVTTSYIVLQYLEIANNLHGYGINLSYGPPCDHVTVQYCKVHDNYFASIQDNGSYDIIQYNTCYHSAVDYHINGGDYDGCIVIGDTSVAYLGMHSTVRYNTIYKTYGEGILMQYTNYTNVYGNRIWDTLAPSIYPDSCSYLNIYKNFIYHTGDTNFWSAGGGTMPGIGLFICDENLIAGHPVGHDQNWYNNIVVNCYIGFAFSNHGDSPGAALINDLIANNTFVCPDNSWSCNVFHVGAASGGSSHSSTLIYNNVVWAHYGNCGDIVGGLTGLTLSNNEWYGTNDSSLTGSNVLYTDPLLIAPTQTIALDQIATPLDPAGYKLGVGSPAIDSALVNATVIDDYWGTPRGASPDRGAHEYT